MSELPTYHEAITPADVVALLRPYVYLSDLPALCRVSAHYWEIFAPLIWEDCLRTARSTGLQTVDDLDWWFKFVYFHLVNTRVRTRSLARVLDMRHFGKDAYYFASDQQDKTVNQSLKRALGLLPGISCILIDGQQDLSSGDIFSIANGETAPRVCMLSMPRTSSPLPSNFADLRCLHNLVYLDISAVPGRVGNIIQPGLLPGLRVLKISDKEIDNSALESLITNIGRNKLWSLDASNNRLADPGVGAILDLCSPLTNRGDAHRDQYFDVEGKLEVTPTYTRDYLRWSFLHESKWSSAFKHPNRYLVDAPIYTEHGGALHQNCEPGRLDTREPIKSDSADGVCRGLLGVDSFHAVEAYGRPGHLTHLDLSNNHISSLGIRQVFDMSNGRLQKFTCDSMLLVPSTPATTRLWPRSAKLHGFPYAHMFRPVFSADLRVARIHHSLVTQVPTLEVDGFSTMSRLYLAETSVLSRWELAFPQAFIPDMNPRLASLTLTRIPRRSSGPLIARLIDFLNLLSAQERDIHDASSSLRRGPAVLAGLRHLRLEFEPDPFEDGFSMTQDLDAEELMKTGEGDFSFFDSSPQRQVTPVVQRQATGRAPAAEFAPVSDQSDQNGSEYLLVDVIRDQQVGQEKVWAGRGDSDNPIVRAYHRLVMDEKVREHAGPATPAQVMAGAPYLSVVFQTAWCMAIMPESLGTPPAQPTLSGMKDVLAELKQFRLAGRAKYAQLKHVGKGAPVRPGAPHGFWLGKLEVSTQEPMSQGRPSQYWK